MASEYTRFFGITLDSSEYHDLLSTLNLSESTYTPRKFGKSTEYRCFYPQGIALCFESQKLDSIDFYKEDRSGNITAKEDGPKKPEQEEEQKRIYKKVDKSVVPGSIPYNATAVDLVNKYGEPEEKGGGLSQKMDIWMRWDGFQVDIPNRDWDTAKDTEWCSLTIFPNT